MTGRRVAVLLAAGLGGAFASPAIAALDCVSATPIACGDSVRGDLARGASGASVYACSASTYGGREQVYALTLATETTVRLTLTTTGSDPDLFVLSACDPATCVAPPADSLMRRLPAGNTTIVVDSRAGDEGPYTLDVACLGDDFTFCTDAPDGGGLVEHDPWGFGNGTWLVKGWLYHPQHTHDQTLRVDGRRKYSTLGGDCPRLPPATFGATPPSGPGFVTWRVAEAEVTETLSEEREGGCCGLLVTIAVTNVDSVPHSYDWRVYHDTAFGDAPAGGNCFDPGSSHPTVDGGTIEVRGVSYLNEVDLLALGAADCRGQVEMFSGEDGSFAASYQVLPPNTPTNMEFLRWNDGAEPCTTWSGLVDGNMSESAPGCTDNSLLFIWRFPAGTGTLAPGETSEARYRIGWRCAWPCAGCESPTMGPAMATDASPCNRGIVVAWSPATFPGAGNGVHHVYRSTMSFADAVTQPPISPPGGVAASPYVDAATAPGTDYYYVVRAESTDFPTCGIGPFVRGSTDDAAAGPATDAADLVGQASEVGNALRATAHGTDTVDFNWRLALPPGPGERYVILRADDRADLPFDLYATTSSQDWTDPAAPPRYDPPHVWFYDVRYGDDCNNLSPD